MAIDSTNIMLEVREVAMRAPRSTSFRFEVYIMAGEDNEWVKPIRVDVITHQRDYFKGYADAIFLDALIGRGDYAYILEPNRDNITVDVFRYPTADMGNGDIDEEITVKRYRGMLLTKEDPGLADARPHASNHDDLNQEIMDIQFQLIQENVHQLRMVTVGRIYRQTVPMNALRSLLTDASQLIDVSDEEIVTGVDVVDGFNETERETIVVPHGTKLINVVSHLQNAEGGLYSTGVGCYLQHNKWYVYPLFDLNRIEREDRTLTVLRVPPNRYTGSERTWRLTEKQVIVIANSDISVRDMGFDEQMSSGNAVRTTNADNLLTFGETGDNKINLERKKNLYEFKSHDMQGDGLTNTQWGKERATGNPFKLYSRLASQGGQFVEISWMHSNTDYLYPGMPVRLYVATNDELEEYHGILLGANDRYVPGRPGPVPDYYVNEARLLLFVNRKRTET